MSAVIKELGVSQTDIVKAMDWLVSNGYVASKDSQLFVSVPNRTRPAPQFGSKLVEVEVVNEPEEIETVTLISDEETLHPKQELEKFILLGVELDDHPVPIFHYNGKYTYWQNGIKFSKKRPAEISPAIMEKLSAIKEARRAAKAAYLKTLKPYATKTKIKPRTKNYKESIYPLFHKNNIVIYLENGQRVGKHYDEIPAELLEKFLAIKKQRETDALKRKLLRAKEKMDEIEKELNNAAENKPTEVSQ
jgi:hypothetical protein